MLSTGWVGCESGVCELLPYVPTDIRTYMHAYRCVWFLLRGFWAVLVGFVLSVQYRTVEEKRPGKIRNRIQL